jgi:hypothetical protein
MAGLILVVCAAVFLFGLVQWARGGATLWEVFHLVRNKPENAKDTDEEKRAAEIRTKMVIRDLETMTDSLLRSSFRVLGFLALAVWLFVIASVIIDAMGLDWLDGLSFQSNRLWGDPYARSNNNTRKQGVYRGNLFQSFGYRQRR